MTKDKLQRVTALALILTVLTVENALAQAYRYRDPYASISQYLMGIRVLIMSVSVGAGFALGWLFSPAAKEIRTTIFLVIAVITVVVGIFSNSLIGWSATYIVSLVGFFAALGYWAGRAVTILSEVPTTFGSSSWASPTEVRANNLFGIQGIPLGKFFGGSVEEEISYSGDKHLITCAPTRSGKGITQIIQTLLSFAGSVFVIDVKGENALITAKARQDMGQKVYRVDPWDIAPIEGIDPARLNPLDWLQPGDPDITENAMHLADALVPRSKEEGGSESFFNNEAVGYLQGVILYVATDEREAGQRHLGRVRDLCLLDDEGLKDLYSRMLESPYHVVASSGARNLQKDPKLLANVLATVQAHTHFLDSARVRECLSTSDFSFADMKSTPMSVFLVVPADRLASFGSYLRLMVQQAITQNARNIGEKPKQPVLFLLDEMPALGRLEMVETSYGLLAGFGVQLHGIVQNFSQLRQIYGEGWETFVANSGVIQYFGSRDRFTAEYFSALCGDTTVWNLSSAVSRVFGTSSGSGGASSSASTTETDTRAATQRKLAYPDELMRMHKTKQLLIVENMNPILATRTPWFEDPRFKDRGVNLHKK